MVVLDLLESSATNVFEWADCKKGKNGKANIDPR